LVVVYELNKTLKVNESLQKKTALCGDSNIKAENHKQSGKIPKNSKEVERDAKEVENYNWASLE
jgi:hypothetical protein